jgi:hypothetical protein
LSLTEKRSPTVSARPPACFISSFSGEDTASISTARSLRRSRSWPCTISGGPPISVASSSPTRISVKRVPSGSLPRV